MNIIGAAATCSPGNFSAIMTSILLWIIGLHDTSAQQVILKSISSTPSSIVHHTNRDGGDISTNFAAAHPDTYNHNTGGGAWNSGSNHDIRESLQIGNYYCGDIITHLMQIVVEGANPSDTLPQTVELDFEFSAQPTGQAGIGYTEIPYVGINYGVGDTGIDDDGGSTATIINNTSQPVNSPDPVTLTCRVDDLEPGEELVLRIDVVMTCDNNPNTNASGNLQGRFMDGAVVALGGMEIPPDAISSGAQTINLKLSGTPLLIDLLSFVGQSLGADGNKLYWETGAEMNSALFELQRMDVEKGRFIPIDSVPAMGTSHSVQKYSCVDASPPVGLSYYRLRMYELDGQSRFSDIVLVNNQERPDRRWVLYPTMARSCVNLNYVSDQTLRANITVIAYSGKPVYAEEGVLIREGDNSISLDVHEFAPGWYAVVLEGRNLNETKPFIKVK